jgi:hypothetical protein
VEFGGYCRSLIYPLVQIHIKGSLASSNMNSFVERLNGTIRREALDHFLLFSEKQVRNITVRFVSSKLAD